MKKLLPRCVSLVCMIAGSAMAADMPLKAPIYKPAPSIVYDWTGFYVGGNVGYSIGRDPSVPFFGPPTGDQVTLAPRGGLAGLQAGFNWQAGSLVLGVESDWQWTDQNDSFCFDCVTTPPGRGIGQKLPWFGTVRGRIGYAVGPALFYATGGAAFGRITQILDCCFGFQATTTLNNSKTGSVVGGGIEAALGGNWTAKVEYLYVDFGSISNTISLSTGGFMTASSDVRDHVGRIGLNYRFGPLAAAPATAAMPVKAPLAVPLYDWTGFYVGGNVGYSAGRDSTQQTFPSGIPVTADLLTLAPGGWLGGGQAGLNWQYDHLVIGVEGDWQWTGQKDSLCRDCTVTPNTLTQTVEHKIPWFATVRGRVGFAVGPALFYATGGVAFAEIDLNTVNTRPPFSPGTASIRFSKTGSVVGGGIEAALGGNWTAKVEYLYLDLGGISATVPDFVPGSVVVLNSDVRDHVARFGLNYRFGGPVVARY